MEKNSQENFLKHVKKMNLTKKKEVAKKMNGHGKSHHNDPVKIEGYNTISGKSSTYKSIMRNKDKVSGNYKKHLDKTYKEEDDFSTRKGE